MTNTCKTCKYWTDDEYNNMCNPVDPDDYEPMDRGFKCKICKMPTQTFCESPVENNGFGLADGSLYYAILVTAEDFGCVRHES